MKIYNVTDKEFLQFGRLLNLDTNEIIAEAKTIDMPKEGSVYVPSVEAFEKLPIMKTIENEYYGELPAQIGYCYGHSDTMNALEWHKCSEINIAVTDMILLLGDIRDIEKDNKYNSDNVMAFRVKAGEAIEVYSTTMHFCPIETSKEGFGCIVCLTKGTNLNLEFEPQDKLLFRKNKWLMAHYENTALLEKGAAGGIYGINYKICGE